MPAVTARHQELGRRWDELSELQADLRHFAAERDWQPSEVPGAAPLNPADIRQVGLMIAGRQSGPFALAIRHIALA